MSATHILLPQQTFLNVIERKYKRQILLPDPIILGTISEYCANFRESARHLLYLQTDSYGAQTITICIVCDRGAMAGVVSSKQPNQPHIY